MKPKPKLEVLSPPLRRQAPAELDAFDEDRVRRELVRFAAAPGLFQKYVERARVRFQKAGELAILEHWIKFYSTGERLIAARNAMERQRSEYLQLASEHKVKAAEKNATVAKLKADIEEQGFRRDKAAYQREHLERFVEGTTENTSESQKSLHDAQERRQLDARWDVHESLHALHSLIELQHWRRQQRDRILKDRSLSADEQSEDMQFIDTLYQQKRAELKVDTRIFEGE